MLAPVSLRRDAGALHELVQALAPLTRLSSPIILVNLLNVAALAVDTAMAGALAGPEVALAALGFATQLVYLSTVLATGLSVGTVAWISRAHGAGDQAGVNQVLQQASLSTFSISVALGALGAAICPWLLRALGAEGAVLASAVSYARPLLLATPLTYFTQVFASALRGVGHSLWPLATGGVAVILNTVLNWALMFGHAGLPALGIEGAAYGTLLAKAVPALWLGCLVVRGSVPGIQLRLRGLRVVTAAQRELLRVGAPAALDYLLLNTAYLMTLALVSHANPAAAAAHSVGVRVLVLAFIPALGASQATAALVGQHLGAGRVQKARSYVWAGLLQATLFMLGASVAVHTWSVPILRVFGIAASSDLYSLGLTWLGIVSLMLPVLGVNIVLVGMMQGAGLTQQSLRFNAIGTLLVQLPAGVLAVHCLDLGERGAWLSMALGFTVRAALGARLFGAGTWLKASKSRTALSRASRSRRSVTCSPIGGSSSRSGA